MEQNGLDYEKCVPFCSDSQLLAIQLSTGFLTNANLMGKLSLGQLFHDLNTSFPFPVEYSQFCADNPDFRCIDKVNSIETFADNPFSNFTFMSKVLARRDNFDMV